jgi:hypothetical protein
MPAWYYCQIIFYPLVIIPVALLIAGTLQICLIFILNFLYHHPHPTRLFILMEHFLMSHTENQNV